STRFSISASLLWLHRRFSFVGVWQEHWTAWRKSRQKARERRLLERRLKEEQKRESSGGTLITQHITELKERGTASAKRIPREPSPREMDFAEPMPQIAAKKTAIEKAQSFAAGTRDFIFPSMNMLRPATGQKAVDEEELLQRASQLTEKCKEFDVHGQ